MFQPFYISQVASQKLTLQEQLCCPWEACSAKPPDVTTTRNGLTALVFVFLSLSISLSPVGVVTLRAVLSLQGGILGGEGGDEVKDILLLDVAPLSLGIETGEGGRCWWGLRVLRQMRGAGVGSVVVD